MSLPGLTTVAEGDLPSGQHWTPQAGASREDFYTFPLAPWPSLARRARQGTRVHPQHAGHALAP